MQRTEVAEGVWCHDCEFFEIEDMTDGNAPTCMACGCPKGRHSAAVVIAEDPEESSA